MLAVENGSGIFMYVETISMVVISAMVVIPNVVQIVSFFAIVPAVMFIIVFLPLQLHLKDAPPVCEKLHSPALFSCFLFDQLCRFLASERQVKPDRCLNAVPISFQDAVHHEKSGNHGCFVLVDGVFIFRSVQIHAYFL